jgi:hypothetical protein
MGRIGRPPKEKTVGDLPTELIAAINRFVDSHRKNSARSIYNKFGLADRGVNERTFRSYVRERRETNHVRESDESHPPLDPYDRAMQLAIERVDAGDPKHLPGISAFLRVCLEQRRVEFDAASEKRAAQLHEIKMTEILAKQNKALSKAAKSTGLTQSQVDEIRTRVLGLA